MWFCALFRGINGNIEKKEIPFAWVHSFDIVQIFNRGINRTKDHLVYYSDDKTDDPNFKLPVRDFFDENDPLGCYYVKIRNCVGKFYLTYIFIFLIRKIYVDKWTEFMYFVENSN